MKPIRSAGLLSFFFPLFLCAQDDAENTETKVAENVAKFVETTDAQRHRVGIKFRAFNNVSASFEGLGAYTPPNPVPPTATGTAKDYDDGFVGVDISGNAGGLTWNWGYDDASQYDASGTGTIAFNQTGVIDGSGSVDDREDFNPGFEVVYEYLLDPGEVSFFGKQIAVQPSLRASFGYVHIDIESNGIAGVDLTRLTDTYALNGVIPPSAPYTGSFAGPGPLLSDTPIRSQQVIASGGTITGSREITAHLIPFKFGPAASLQLQDRFAVDLSAGLTFAPIFGDFDVTETTTVPGVGASKRSVDDDESSILGGFYLDLGIAYQLNQSWSIHATAGCRYLSSFDMESDGVRAELEFDEVYTLGFGISKQF